MLTATAVTITNECNDGGEEKQTVRQTLGDRNGTRMALIHSTPAQANYAGAQ